MKIPMREKYVDESVGVFFIFGTSSNNTVDVSDGNRDIFTNLPLEVATQVVDAQQKFREKLYELLCQ